MTQPVIAPKEFFALAQRFKGINAFGATCQCALESSMFSSELAAKARNFAGIKAGKDWIAAGKPVYNKASAECSGGKWTKPVSSFRRYGSVESFLADYEAKIKSNYPVSAAHTDNVWSYFAGLTCGRYGPWATDPDYFAKLAKMAYSLGAPLLGKGWYFRLTGPAFRHAEDEYILSSSQKSMMFQASSEAFTRRWDEK